jgi:hypothetical protein
LVAVRHGHLHRGTRPPRHCPTSRLCIGFPTATSLVLGIYERATPFSSDTRRRLCALGRAPGGLRARARTRRPAGHQPRQVGHPTQKPPLAPASCAAGRRAGRPADTARMVALVAHDWLMKFLKSRDELATAAHSITSSASASSIGGISSPSALAVCRLMTNSNFVDCSTGRWQAWRPSGFDRCRRRPDDTCPHDRYRRPSAPASL